MAFTTEQQQILANLRSGIDWTHDGPIPGESICDCNGTTEDSCEYGREAAASMRRVADHLVAGELQEASAEERQWGDDPATQAWRDEVEASRPQAETLELYEDNGGTLWFVAPEEGVAVEMPRTGDFLTDCRTYRDAWTPEDFEEDLRGLDSVQELLDDQQTTHVATYRITEDDLHIHVEPEKMGHAAREYLGASLEEWQKIEIVTVREDVEIAGYGLFRAGTYRVAMPESYDPEEVTATDIVHDPALRKLRDAQ